MIREIDGGMKLNRKQVYKVEKMQEASTLYFCQCGKPYLSFPALYLHARSKHNIKLTSKMNSKVCQIKVQKDVEMITYFISPRTCPSLNLIEETLDKNSEGKVLIKDDSPSQASSPQPKYNTSLKNAISQYVAQNESETVFIPRNMLMAELDFFATQYYEKCFRNDEDWPSPTAYDIPYYFNIFMIYHLPQKFKGSWFQLAKQQVGYELYHFSKWLKNNKMTQHEVTYFPQWNI